MSETEYMLGTHCGVTLAGIKPASLFGIGRTEARALGYYARHFRKKGFCFRALRVNSAKILLYVYNSEQLDSILSDAKNKEFLAKHGYIYDSTAKAIDILHSRMAANDFPHEIGIFLGYPLEDVKGFIASPKDGVMLCGYWKVYSDVQKKSEIFCRYKQCKEQICHKLKRGIPLTAIFN